MADRITATLEELEVRARALASLGGRRILGIAGTPGAGKSTIAQALVDRLGDLAVFVPMDGYHFANEVLINLGRRERKGAPDTFDADGYISLLQRMRAQTTQMVYAPRFRRDLEEPIGSAIPVDPNIPLVITEGNYLLLDTPPWDQVRELLDETWFLEPDESLRMERLIDRHIEFGKDPEQAKEWAMGSDERNAEVIRASASNADLIVTVIEE